MDDFCVYIVLVNYRGLEDTVHCIDSLKKGSFQNFKVILVDNASPDGSGKKLLEIYRNDKQIEIILSENNLGFAGGNNLALKEIIERNGKAILLLNNDTEVEKNFLFNLLDGWDMKNARTPRINYYADKEKTWYAAGRFNFNKGIVENGNPCSNQQVNFASGCCVLLSESIINAIGFLSDDYFMYYEDVDYSLRIINAGFTIEYIADALVFHKVGQSSGGNKSEMSIYYNNRNRFYIIRKYNLGIRCKVYTCLTRGFRVIKSVFTGGKDKRAIISGFVDYKKGIKGRGKRY